MKELNPDSTDAIVNADSDTSTVCPDIGDTCDSSILKVCVVCNFVLLCWFRLLSRAYSMNLHLLSLLLWRWLVVIVPNTRLVIMCFGLFEVKLFRWIPV